MIFVAGIKTSLSAKTPASAKSPASRLERYFSLDLYSGFNSTFSGNEENAESRSCNLGGKLNGAFSEFRYYTNQKDYNFGFSLFTDRIFKSFPMQFKTGNLSVAGSISKMNNPLLSASASPFSTVQSTPSVITASLPGYSTYSKPISAFGQGSFINTSKINIFRKATVNYWNNSENSEEALSIYLVLAPTNKLNISMTSTIGSFYLDQKSGTSWFLKENFYHADLHLCMLNQIAVSSQKASALFSVASYSTPFGRLLSVYKSENKLKTENFTFNLSFFFNNYQNLLTSSQKQLDRCLQIKTGIQYDFKTGKRLPFFVKTGFAVYSDFNLEEDSHDLKAGSGVQVNCLFFSATVSLTSDFELNTQNQISPSITFETATLSLKTSIYINKSTLNLGSSFTANPSKDFLDFSFTQKYSAGINFPVSLNPWVSVSYSQSDKNSEITNQKISISAGAKFSSKRINWTIKTGAVISTQ